ncbi:MAG: HEAT repeat domain-containing protein, partial [Phycisphaeraceae bacterium]
MMTKLKRIYRLIRPIADPIVDRAMAEALPTADPEAQQLLVLSLLERRDETARMGLVQHLHLLSPQLQQLIVSQAHRLDAVLRAAAEQGEPTTRLNVVDMVTRAQTFRLAYLMSAQLHHSDSRVRRAAAAGMLNLANIIEDPPVPAQGGLNPEAEAITAQSGTVSAEGGGGAGGGEAAKRVRWLTAALAEGCSCYHQHGRQDVLAAAAVLGPARPRALMQQLTDRRCAAHTVLRDMIRHADRPEIQYALLSYASLAVLEPVVVEGLAGRHIPSALPSIWRTAHLLAVPDVRSAVRKVTPGQHLLPTESSLATLPVEVERLVPRWVIAVRADRADQVQALQPLSVAGDRTTRLLALRALREIDDPAADETVSAMCYDADATLACMALRHLRSRRWPGLTRLTVKLISSSHVAVRRLAERELAPVGFRRLWQHWNQMDVATQQSAGRAVMKIDRRFTQQLHQKLRDADPGVRFKAVMMVRSLEQASEHDARLIELLKDSDSRVASASARALGMAAPTAESADSLSEALTHEDDRVRSNAIESLESLGQAEQANAALLALADQSGNRSRATAIRSLMKMPVADALPQLMKMLADTRP